MGTSRVTERVARGVKFAPYGVAVMRYIESFVSDMNLFVEPHDLRVSPVRPVPGTFKDWF